MPSVLATSWDKVILALQARLMSSTGLPAECVLIQEDQTLPEVTQAEQFLLLWEAAGKVDRPIWQGGSRVDSRLVQEFTVTVWTRCYLDEPTSSLVWLTDPALGHAVWRHKVYEALVSDVLTDAQDDWLGLPVVPVGQGKASRDKEQREWGSSTLTFAVVYEMNLSLSPVL